MRSKAPTFDDFWKAYPLHKGKIETERAWNRLSAGDKQKALAGIPRYREECQRTGMAIKYPQGWLNGHRWDDEYEEPNGTFERPRQTGSGVSQGAGGTKTELSGNASPTPPSSDTLSDMETW